jgi:short coiled-coil protein
VPRDHPEIEIQEEEFPPDDVRTMNPRRNSVDIERLGQEARQTSKE